MHRPDPVPRGWPEHGAFFLGGALRYSLLLVLLLVAACSRTADPRLEMPALAAADYYWIAAQIFRNETNGKLEYLAHWNDGEDFPSLGIGHFIWFPEHVDAPFDESFPTMLAYVREHADACSPVPEWLRTPAIPAAPWADKAAFDAARDTPQMTALRDWLASTAPQQAQYIVASFNARWNALELEDGDKAVLTELLHRLLASPEGLFAVIDYYNFKGLGSNPRERYAGEGWGLVQVLRDVAERPDKVNTSLVEQFAKAAAGRLALRVVNAPPERNEARWLEGWHRRVAAYASNARTHAATAGSAFRVAPYLQDVTAAAATISWFSGDATPGAVTLPADDKIALEVSPPRHACELAYHLAEFARLDGAGFPPWQQTATLTGLQPGHDYTIAVQQNGETAAVNVRTPAADAVHFVVYADSETEPESTGKRARWSAAQHGAGNERRYPVDQTTGYRANLAEISAKRPDFVAIAGDLVESGGEQRDWDEFWRHNAALAASVPIVPALGNHDYYGGPGDLGGYGASGTARALAKYRTYFNRPAYYAHDHGPVAVIAIDANNGTPERSATDTNWYLDNTAPDWQPGSAQWQWLEKELARAQREKAFTFVLFHPAPYTSGIHGRPPGTGEGENFASGIPLDLLTPLFLRYGVDAVFNGHDEMYEYSIVRGREQTGDGAEADHAVHFMDVGIGGDGLRGPDPLAVNPHRVFLAHEDAPEQWSDDGRLLDGGKHYGHVDVRVTRSDSGTWHAQLEPVYLFPIMTANGDVEAFEARRYHEPVMLENSRVD